MGLRGPRGENYWPAGAPPQTDADRPPPTPNDWHRRARDWFNALKKGPTAQYMLRSDWTVALVAGDALSRWCENPNAPTSLLSTWERVAASLMSTHRTRQAGGVADQLDFSLASVDDIVAPTKAELRERTFGTARV